MVKPVLLICSCRKYEEYLHAAIRRFDRPEWTIIGVIGGGGGTASYDATTRILTLPGSDSYETLPAKLHAAYSWIFANRPGIPGIFKTDEDMVFDLDILAGAVSENVAIPYWGVTASICQAAPVNPARIQHRFDDTSLRPMHQSAVYCFGAGYWLSAEALPHIRDAVADYRTSCLEDVCTGFVMNQAGWKPARIRVPCREVERSPELLQLQ